jgi:hypothetical protein
MGTTTLRPSTSAELSTQFDAPVHVVVALDD